MGTDLPAQEMIQLDQDRRRNDTPFAPPAEKLAAHLMVTIARVESGNDRTGV
jgi:hypothetical protein